MSPELRDKVRNVQRIPLGLEATLLQLKAGYMYATFLNLPIKLFPCNAGRTIYVPRTMPDKYASFTQNLHSNQGLIIFMCIIGGPHLCFIDSPTSISSLLSFFDTAFPRSIAR